MDKNRQKALKNKEIDSVTKTIISVYESDFKRLEKIQYFVEDWNNLKNAYRNFINSDLFRNLINEQKKYIRDEGLDKVDGFDMDEDGIKFFNFHYPILRIHFQDKVDKPAGESPFLFIQTPNLIERVENKYKHFKDCLNNEILPTEQLDNFTYYWPKLNLDYSATLIHLTYGLPKSFIEFKLGMIAPHHVEGFHFDIVDEDIHGRKRLLIDIDTRFSDDILMERFKEIMQLFKIKYENNSEDIFGFKKIPKQRISKNNLTQIQMYADFRDGISVWNIIKNRYPNFSETPEKRNIENAFRWGKKYIERGKTIQGQGKLSESEIKRINNDKAKTIRAIFNKIEFNPDIETFEGTIRQDELIRNKFSNEEIAETFLEDSYYDYSKKTVPKQDN